VVNVEFGAPTEQARSILRNIESAALLIVGTINRRWHKRLLKGRARSPDFAADTTSFQLQALVDSTLKRLRQLPATQRRVVAALEQG